MISAHTITSVKGAVAYYAEKDPVLAEGDFAGYLSDGQGDLESVIAAREGGKEGGAGGEKGGRSRGEGGEVDGVLVSEFELSLAPGEVFVKDPGIGPESREGNYLNGEWFGKGAEKLGLEGRINREVFTQLLEGKLPNGETIGDDNPEKEHRPGWDFVLSAPKSVSIMALIGGDKRLVEAHESAVKAAWGWAEKELAASRKTIGGETVESKTGNVVMGLMTHALTREGDPGLHTHGVVMNVTQREDGEWRAMESLRLWKFNRTVSLIYQSELAKNVVDLGYNIRSNDGMKGRDAGDDVEYFEIEGISREQILTASKRRVEIERVAEERGVKDAATLAEITMELRKNKTKEDGRSVVERWDDEHAQYKDFMRTLVEESKEKPEKMAGVVSEKTQVIEEQKSGFRAFFDRVVGWFKGQTKEPEAPKLTDGDGKGFGSEVEHRLKSGMTREHVVGYDGLIKASLRRSMGVLTIKDVDDAIKEGVREGRYVETRDQHTNGLEERAFTTPEAIEMERKVLETMGRGKGVMPSIMSAKEAESVLIERGMDAQTDFFSATKMVLTSNDRFMAIQGYAGVGKTFGVIAHLKGVAEENGLVVKGFAPTSSATENLEAKTGIESRTVASLLTSLRGEEARNKKVVASKTPELWIVDESGMKGTKDVGDLVRFAELKNARVLFVGDTEQIGAVPAGKPFKLAQMAGVQTARLGNILRQRGARYKSVVYQVIEAAAAKDVSEKKAILNDALTKLGDSVTVIGSRSGGKIVDFGRAPYGFREGKHEAMEDDVGMFVAGKIVGQGAGYIDGDETKAKSYFVTVTDKEGKERTLWGKGLAAAVNDAEAGIGDHILLQVEGRNALKSGYVQTKWRGTKLDEMPDKSRGSDSFFVTLEDGAGKQKTLWGADLERALEGFDRGDLVDLRVRGKEVVKLPDGIEGKLSIWEATRVRELRVDDGQMAQEARYEAAANSYVGRSEQDRKETILVIQDHQSRGVVNGKIRDLLIERGVLTEDRPVERLQSKQVDEVLKTSWRGYEAGDVVVFGKDQSKDKSGLRANVEYDVVSVDLERNKVKVMDGNGKVFDFQPGARHGQLGGVEIFTKLESRLAVGEEIVWKSNDDRNFRDARRNGRIGKVISMDGDSAVVETDKGVFTMDVTKDKRWDYAYSRTGPGSQGLDAKKAVVLFESHRKNLNDMKKLYTAITRGEHEIEFIVDDRDRFVDAVAERDGEKKSALGKLVESLSLTLGKNDKDKGQDVASSEKDNKAREETEKNKPKGAGVKALKEALGKNDAVEFSERINGGQVVEYGNAPYQFPEFKDRQVGGSFIAGKVAQIAEGPDGFSVELEGAQGRKELVQDEGLRGLMEKEGLGEGSFVMLSKQEGAWRALKLERHPDDKQMRGNDSFFVRLADGDREQVVWGVKIPEALKGVGVGERITLKRSAQEQVKTKDGGIANRNDWLSEPLTEEGAVGDIMLARKARDAVAGTDGVRVFRAGIDGQVLDSAIRDGMRERGLLRDEDEFVRWEKKNVGHLAGQWRAYSPGDAVVFEQERPGEKVKVREVYRVTGVDGTQNKVTLEGREGGQVVINPSKLDKRIGAVSIYKEDRGLVGVGDRLRVTVDENVISGRVAARSGSVVTLEHDGKTQAVDLGRNKAWSYRYSEGVDGATLNDGESGVLVLGGARDRRDDGAAVHLISSGGDRLRIIADASLAAEQRESPQKTPSAAVDRERIDGVREQARQKVAEDEGKKVSQEREFGL